MGYYLVNDTDLTAIADTIRTKSGNNNSLIFPNEFSNAISNLSIHETEQMRTNNLVCTHSAISKNMSPGTKFSVDLTYNLPIPEGYAFGRVVRWYVSGISSAFSYGGSLVDDPPTNTFAQITVYANSNCPANTSVSIAANTITISLIYTLVYIG